MSNSDIDRYVRSQQGVMTDAERDRMIANLTRYRESDIDASDFEPTFYSRGIQELPGFQAANTTDVTTPVTNRTVARYLGQAPADLSLITLHNVVVTACATITWAEVGIATSLVMTARANVDLIPNGFTDVSATFNSTGNKDTEVTVNIARGAHVWGLWGQQATTLYTLRGGIGDRLTAGYVQFADTTRPSTMASPTSFATTIGAASDAWFAFSW